MAFTRYSLDLDNPWENSKGMWFFDQIPRVAPSKKKDAPSSKINLSPKTSFCSKLSAEKAWSPPKQSSAALRNQHPSPGTTPGGHFSSTIKPLPASPWQGGGGGRGPPGPVYSFFF